MNELTKKMVEERAKKLYEIFRPDLSWEKFSDEYITSAVQWRNVATYTLASELRCRFEELEKNYFIDPTDARERITELTEQLKDLGEVL